MEKITSFEQLISWQKSAELAKHIYGITKFFPSNERFALTDQIQRSVVSVSANIAEGFGRVSKAEKLQFYNIAYGSLLETKSHLLIADKLGYLTISEHNNTMQLITDVQKLIIASRKALHNV
jgi:four helix bundle protein